jgi:hypothetical protein
MNMRLGFLVYGLLISIIYLMDFLYLQRGLESRPCREILYIRCTHIMRVLFCCPKDNSNFTFTFYFKYFLRILCTFYLSTFCLWYFLLLLKSFYKFKVI